MLDSRLTFQAHTDYMKSKTFGKIKLLGRVRNIIDKETALLLYKCLILPIYDYCDYVYYPLGANSIDVLQKLQNVALRTIICAEPCTSTETLHTTLQLPHLTNRRKFHVAVQMYDFVSGNCPEACANLFTQLNTHRQRCTRSEQDDLLVVPKRRLVTTERSICYYGVVVWNSIPDNIRKSPSREIFKARLQTLWQI